MKLGARILGLCLTVLMSACQSEEKSSTNLVDKNLIFASQQTSAMLDFLGDSELNPRTLERDGSIRLVKPRDWTSGFFPGCLWYLYEYTKDEQWKTAAHKFTMNLQEQQFNGGTHDMGFKMYCSFGNGLRLTGEEAYQEILLQSARTLITRFNPRVGCIRSWDHHQHLWQYPVIIDNMMNLELLFWAFKTSGDSTFYKIAVSHAETTLKNHFRPDNSSWHVLNYDTTTGAVLDRHTHQGLAHESAWARGQAWGLYGYTMCYRETNQTNFLDQARKIADFILNHKNLPEDAVPYWDFNAPGVGTTPRDASAAAIICSALYELSEHLGAEGQSYKNAADKILRSLSSPEYLSERGANQNFLLKHSVGAFPKNTEVDAPLIYADYYFLEANLRSLKIESEAN